MLKMNFVIIGLFLVISCKMLYKEKLNYISPSNDESMHLGLMINKESVKLSFSFDNRDSLMNDILMKSYDKSQKEVNSVYFESSLDSGLNSKPIGLVKKKPAKRIIIKNRKKNVFLPLLKFIENKVTQFNFVHNYIHKESINNWIKLKQTDRNLRRLENSITVTTINSAGFCYMNSEYFNNYKPVGVYIDGNTINYNTSNCKTVNTANHIIKIVYDQPVTSCENMFYYISYIESIDLSNFDTSQVVSMKSMFGYCTGLKSVNFGNLDTSKVSIMKNIL